MTRDENGVHEEGLAGEGADALVLAVKVVIATVGLLGGAYGFILFCDLFLNKLN